MRKWIIGALALLLVCAPAGASWDPTKPANLAPIVSADIRANWDAIGQTVGTNNLLADNTFLVWAAGDTTVPSYWTTSGAGLAIARTGTGLGDTTRKVGAFAVKLTAGGGAAAFFQQALFSISTFDDHIKGLQFSAGAWVSCANASAGKIQFFDGNDTSTSAFAPAGGAWTWLTLTHPVNNSGLATQLQFRLQVAISQTCYISGPTVIYGPVIPQYFQPSVPTVNSLHWFIAGNQSTGTNKARWTMERPGIVRDVQLEIVTAPTTQALIVDLNTWDGAAFTSMFSTRPQIAAAASRGGASPDSTYARRCFVGQVGASIVAGGVIALDIDQVGTGTVGADLSINIRYLTFSRPLEQFYAKDSVG